MICYALVVLFALALRIHLVYENRRRAAVDVSLTGRMMVSLEEDLTDKQVVGMRYRL